MKRVKIIYKPLRWLPWKKSRIIDIPENWKEITEHQFPFIVDFTEESRGLDDLLAVLAGISPGSVRSDVKYAIVSHLSFIQKPSYCDHFIFKSIAGAGAPDLNKVTASVFWKADRYYYNYKAGNNKSLSLLVACLYNSSGATKIKDEDLSIQSKLIATWEDPRTLYYVAVNYRYVRQYLSAKYSHFFYLISLLHRYEKEEPELFRYVNSVFERIIPIPLYKTDMEAPLVDFLDRAEKEIRKTNPRLLHRDLSYLELIRAT